jgi:hypothetical protein
MPHCLNHLQKLCHLFSFSHQGHAVAFSSLINYKLCIYVLCIYSRWVTLQFSLSYTLIDATELSDPAEPILRNRTTREGIPLWSNWDPVHLAPAAYRELAEAVLVTSTADTSDDTASESASVTTCASHGKRLPESVITVPEVPATKRGRTGSGVKPAGWLHGQAEPRYWPTWHDNIRGRPGGRYGSTRRPWTRRGARARGAGGAWRWWSFMIDHERYTKNYILYVHTFPFFFSFFFFI